MRGRKEKAGDQRRGPEDQEKKRRLDWVPAGEENCSSTLLQPSVMMNDCFPTRLHSVSLDTEHLNTLVSSPGREAGSGRGGYDHAGHWQTERVTSLRGHRTEGNQSRALFMNLLSTQGKRRLHLSAQQGSPDGVGTKSVQATGSVRGPATADDEAERQSNEYFSTGGGGVGSFCCGMERADSRLEKSACTCLPTFCSC